MPIWLIERTDDVDWDETQGVVVIADTPEQAVDLVKNRTKKHEDPTAWDNADISEVNPDDEPHIVLVNFKAG